jgi:large repetitive protein
MPGGVASGRLSINLQQKKTHYNVLSSTEFFGGVFVFTIGVRSALLLFVLVPGLRGLTPVPLPSSTTYSVQATPSTIVFGQTVTFAASVADAVNPLNPAPTGTVTFSVGGVTLGTATLNAIGAASLTVAVPLSLGSYTISAQYNPSGANAYAASSGSGTPNGFIVVNPGSTPSTTSNVQATPSTIGVGQSATFTAHVVDTATTTSMTSGPAGNTPYGSTTPYVTTVSFTGGGTATGTVTFCDTTVGTCSASTGPNIIGTVALTSGSNNIASLVPATPLSIGSHTIIANYAGDSFYASSTSTNSIVTNIQATNTTTSYTLTPGGGSAAAPPATIVYSQAISGTATVTAQNGGGTPTGTVQFAADGTSAGSPAALTGGSTALTSLGSLLSVGNHTVSATYTPAGGTGWNASVGNNGGATAITVNKASGAVGSPALSAGAGTATPTFTIDVTGAAPATANPTSGIVTLYDGTPGNVGASTQVGTGSLSGAPPNPNRATIQSSALSPGGHTIWAAYAGNAQFLGGNSAGTSYTNTTPTSTTVQTPTGPTTFTYGQSVSYTGTVAAASGVNNPGGAGNSGNTLTFCFARSATPGTLVLCSSGIQVVNSFAGPTVGQASYTVPGSNTTNPPALAPGSYVLTTTYHNQDGSFANSGPSTALNVTVSQAGAPFTITSTIAAGQSLTVTQPITVTATYTGSLLPNPTGSVTFFNSANGGTVGTTPICTATVVNGVATCTATAGPGAAAGLQVGAVTISIAYAGDSNYTLGTVTTESITVAKDQVNMTVTATSADSPNPTQMGRTVTLTATVSAKTINVSPAGTTPAQTNISITPPATNVSSSTCGTPTPGATTTNSATVSCTFVLSGTLPSPASLNFSASYSGDNYTASAGISNSISVSPGAATHFTVSAPSTATAGTAFNFTVTALDQFNNTATSYGGTAHFTSSDGISVLPANSHLTNGAGTFSATLKTAGTQTIAATDTVTSSIAGTSNSITVSPATTSTALSPSSATVTYGAAVTFTATVTSNASPVSSGTVTFTDTTTAATLAANVALNSSGQAAVTSTLAAGPHTVQATYNNDANHAASSNTTSVTVNKANLTVTANNLSKIFGAALPALTTTITGFVNGDTQQSATTGSPGLSTTATASSPVGPYPITVTQGNLAASNYTFTPVNGTLTIGKAGTSTLLTSSGVSGPLVATVSALAPGAGVPTGTVQFLNGATVVGSATLVAGTATLGAPVGTYTAAYGGDGNFTASNSNATTLYSTAASTLSLSSSVNPSTLGQAVTFTATLSTSGGSPNAPAVTGTVQFLDGAKPLGTSSLSGGQATYTTSALAGGSHTIVAQYSGDATWPAATAIYGQTVDATVTMTVTAAPTNPAFGQAVALTAKVGASSVPAGFAAPTGQVVFSTPGANPFAPGIPLGTATLASGTAAISVSTLPVGVQTITAQYSGDATWSGATGQVTVTVQQAATMTTATLTLAVGQLTLNGAVAAAAPASGTPTGSVQFVDTSSNVVVGSATLSGGKGSATVAASAASTVIGKPVVAVYSGDANYKTSTSAPLPTAVNAALNSSANFAADEIASLFGIAGLSGDTAGTLPLTTSLGGVTVNIVDSNGTGHLALLYGVFGSAGQINFVVPAGMASGLAEVVITLPGGGTITAVMNIAGLAPGIFTANQNGQGPFAGQVIWVHADGSETVANAATFHSDTHSYMPTPISLGAAGDQVYLVLYGTGIRHAGTVTATVNGVSVPVVYSGPQGTYPGMDQINVGPLPPSLAGAGVVNLVITFDGQAANTVTVSFQ